MTTQKNKLPPALIWTVGILIALLCVTGIAAMLGWTPDTIKEEPKVEKEVRYLPAKPTPVPAKPVASNHCPTCGVIESTHVINVKGDADGVGAVGGAVVGGLLGHQVGGGHGKDAATVVGALGGAYAGNEIEKNMNSSKRYQTTVRFDEGGSRVFTTSHPTNWHPGDRVKVVNGAIVSR